MDRIVQCTRCKNKHRESERIDKKSDKGNWSDVVCPKCGGKTMFVLSKIPDESLTEFCESIDKTDWQQELKP